MMESSLQQRTAGYKSIHDGKSSNPPEELSIEELLTHIGFGWPQVKLTLLGGVAWISMGMELMVVAILGPILEEDWGITPLQQALLTSLMFLGNVIGSPICGYIADKFGRRKLLVLSCAWTTIYAVLCTVAPNYVWMVILRFLMGMGVTGANLLPGYYSELMAPKYRGKMTMVVLLFWAMGSTLSVLSALAFLRFGWRYWLLTSAVPSLFFVLTSSCIPESPRYELACGRSDEAWKILDSLAKGNGCSLPDVKLRKLEVKPKGRLVDLFTRNLMRTTLLVGGLWAIAGMTYYGITLVSTYLTQVGNTCGTDLIKVEASCKLEYTGITNETLWELLWTMSADLPGILVSVLIIDLLGRKGSMAVQQLLYMVVCLLLLICMQKIPMITLLFIGRFAVAGWNQVLYLYTLEVFPTEVRCIGLAYGICLTNVGGTLTPAIAQVLVQYSAYSGLLIYAMLTVLAVVLVVLLPIETMKREMADNFAE